MVFNCPLFIPTFTFAFNDLLRYLPQNFYNVLVAWKYGKTQSTWCIDGGKLLLFAADP
jgi:hypothetical protein